MDTAVAEEYIEYYADKYKKLTREHKFAIPLCKRTNKNEIYNAIEATSNIPAGYYITAECTRDVEKFAQKITWEIWSQRWTFLCRRSCY